MKSETFIKAESTHEHYNAEACVVLCFDARFSEAYETFLAQRGFSKSHVDLVKRAGGAQALAATGGFGKEDTLDEIQKSIMLHKTERLILTVHMDCGGYGGAKTFDNDHQKEWDHHVSELKKAALLARATFSGIQNIETWIVDFDGFHDAAISFS